MPINYLATGTITIQDSAPSGNSPTAGSFVQFSNLDPNAGTLGFSVSGTWTASGGLIANGTDDGVSWFALGADSIINVIDNVAQGSVASGVNGVYEVNAVGLLGIRIDAQGAVTGTATVSLFQSTNALPQYANTPANGIQYKYIAAATPTVVKASAGFLAKVIVISSGSAVSPFYDNPSAASGNILFELPASPTIGTVYTVQIPATTGIYCGGGTNSSAVTVLYD